MQKLRAMDSIKLASIWVVWGWFAIGTLGWSFFVVLEYFGIQESAVLWVQAIGSVMAIVAAGYFPIWHSRVAQARREESLLKLIQILADEAREAIHLLTSNFFAPEHELVRMDKYLQHNRDHGWLSLLGRIDQIPIAEVPSEAVAHLGTIREAVAFSYSVAERLPLWINAGSSHPKDVITLRAKRALVDIARSRINVVGCAEVNSNANRSEAIIKFEQPIIDYGVNDYTIYRRDFRFGLPDGALPKKTMLQIVEPYSNSHPVTEYIEKLDEECINIIQVNKKILTRIWVIVDRQGCQ